MDANQIQARTMAKEKKNERPGNALELRSRTIKKRKGPNISPNNRKRKKPNEKPKRCSLRLISNEVLSTFRNFLRTEDETLLTIDNCEASEHVPTEEEAAQREVNRQIESDKIGSSSSGSDIEEEDERNFFHKGYVLRKDMKQPDMEKCKMYESIILKSINIFFESRGGSEILRSDCKDNVARSISQFHCANCVRKRCGKSPFDSSSISISKEEEFPEKSCILAFLGYIFCHGEKKGTYSRIEEVREPIGLGFWESKRSYLLTFVY